MNKDKTFWIDGFTGHVKDGYYFRAFDLVKFIKRLEEEENKKVVGLEFDGNNVNVIVKK